MKGKIPVECEREDTNENPERRIWQIGKTHKKEEDKGKYIWRIITTNLDLYKLTCFREPTDRKKLNQSWVLFFVCI